MSLYFTNNTAADKRAFLIQEKIAEFQRETPSLTYDAAFTKALAELPDVAAAMQQSADAQAGASAAATASEVVEFGGEKISRTTKSSKRSAAKSPPSQSAKNER